MSPDSAHRRVLLSTTVYVSITLLSWASSFVAIGFALDDFSPGSLTLLRFLVSALLVSVVVAPRYGLRRFFHLSAGDLGRLGAMAVTGAVLYNLFLVIGRQTVNSFGASVLINTAPIWTALFALLILGERLRRTAWFGVLLGFLGAVFVAASGGELAFELVGAVFVLLAACCQGFYFVILRSVVRRVGPGRTTAFTFLFAAMASTPYSSLLIKELPLASGTATAAVIYLAAVPGGLGVWSWSQVAKRLPASRQAVFLYFVPPITALLAWVALGEVPRWTTALGGSITIAGAILVGRSPRSCAPTAVARAKADPSSRGAETDGRS